MTLMFIYHIDLTLTVAMAAKISLNRDNVILDHNLEVLQTVFSAELNTKKDILIFYVSCYHLSSI